MDDEADGVGAHKSRVLPRDPRGAIGAPSSLVRDAHRLWLTVHVWTLRAENRFLPRNLRTTERPGAPGDLAAEARAFLDAGVDGLITDHPDLVLAVPDERHASSDVHRLATTRQPAATTLGACTFSGPPSPPPARLPPQRRRAALRERVGQSV